MRDPYSILGVSKSAGPDEIKAAWRSTAKALHPDQNPGDPQAASRFTEAGRAYDLLKDPNKRRLFDEARARATADRSAGERNRTSSDRAAKEKTFMEQRAEKARADAEARAAAEARARAEARAAAQAAKAEAATKAEAARADTVRQEPAEEAEEVVAKIFGTKKAADAKPDAAQTASPPSKEARASSYAAAEEAAAYAGEPESGPNGLKPSPALELINYVFKRLTRQVPPPQRAPDLMIDVPVSIEDILQRVNPAVTLPDGKLLSVTLPDDAMDARQIRIEGYGYRLPGMKRGDVVATLRLKPHKWFRADGHDLFTHVDIDIENAVLGCETKVQTPDGDTVSVTVPAWSGSNQSLRIAGKGLPKRRGERGDLIAEVRVLLWDHPDQKVIDLMRSLREGLYL